VLVVALMQISGVGSELRLASRARCSGVLRRQSRGEVPMQKLAVAIATALFALSAPAFAADAKKEEKKDEKKEAKKDEKKKAAKGGC
jgi:hypothetical protein